MFRRQARSVWTTVWRLWLLAVPLLILAPASTTAGDAQGAFTTLAAPQPEYVIGPQDKLRIRVADIKGLESDEEQVDDHGDIQLPLIGQMTVAGKTTGEVRDEISKQLERYLQAPEVSVALEESASLKVTVEGEVKNPGVFAMKGRTTLMEAIAMAGGPGDTANVHKVAVIREVNGLRSAAICDYGAIEAGKAPDPVLQGSDIVVVNTSTSKSVWSQVLKNLPIFTMLAYLR